MIYNPNSSRGSEPLAVAPVWCRLEVIGSGNRADLVLPTWQRPLPSIRGDQNRVSYEFRVNPETVEIDNVASVKKLAVLGTAQPLLAYQHSETVVKLPTVRFWSPGSNLDISKDLMMLTEWTKPVESTWEPPKLSFKFGDLTYEPVLLVSFKYTVTQMRSGKPVEAEGSMELAIAPDEPVAQEAPDGTKLSERERTEYARQITDTLRNSLPAGATVSVSERGMAQYELNGVNTSIGSIWSILGSAVRPGRTEATTATEPTQQQSNQRGV